MAEPNAEVVRRMYEAFLAGASEEFREGQLPAAFREGLDPEVVWDMTEAGLPDSGEGRFQGHEGTVAFWQSFLSAWQTVDFNYELEEIGDQVLGLIHQRLRGLSTGIEIPAEYVQLISFRAGRVLYVKILPDRDAALRDAATERSS